MKLLSQVGGLDLKAALKPLIIKKYFFYLLDKKNKMCTFILTILNNKKDIK